MHHAHKPRYDFPCNSIESPLGSARLKEKNVLKKVLLWAAAVVVAVTLVMTAAYFRDMNRAYDRVRARGVVVPSPYGNIEYVESGFGPEVLVIHGSGGGYDQGELIANAVLGRNFHWIAPSRFGYLGSGVYEGATWDDQADAYAYLLDQLNIEKVAVVAMSQGGPSALLFAVLHPERVSSLTLISCGVAPATTSDQAQANEKGNALTTIFRSDLAYWLVSKLFRKQLMGLIGASDEVIAGLSSDQLQLFERFIADMNPVSLRTAGVILDNTLTLPGERIAAITAPTLILHATDDSLQLFRNAEFAATTISNSSLMRFGRGGHFLIGVENPVVGEAVRNHIRKHTSEVHQ
jgi:pimeloyl-ACP methyl ester carboxylesterase